VKGKLPLVALVVTVEAVFFQCARAMQRLGCGAARRTDPEAYRPPVRCLRP